MRQQCIAYFSFPNSETNVTLHQSNIAIFFLIQTRPKTVSGIWSRVTNWPGHQSKTMWVNPILFRQLCLTLNTSSWNWLLCYVCVLDCGKGKVAADTSDCYLTFHELKLLLQGDREWVQHFTLPRHTRRDYLYIGQSQLALPMSKEHFLEINSHIFHPLIC